MSRRRMPKKRLSTSAPKDGTPLGDLSDAELVEELARRRVARRGEMDLDAIESFIEGAQSQIGEDALAATVAALTPEGSEAKPCPNCGRPVPVKTHNRMRHVLTTAGELRLARNYHYCRRCQHGFYPRDRELEPPLPDGDLLELGPPRCRSRGAKMRGGFKRAGAARGVSSSVRRASPVAGHRGRRKHAADARGVMEGSEGGGGRARRRDHRGEESAQRLRSALRRRAGREARVCRLAEGRSRSRARR